MKHRSEWDDDARVPSELIAQARPRLYTEDKIRLAYAPIQRKARTAV